MNELNMYNILKNLLSKQELNGLSGIVVIEDYDGYVMFNEYKIKPTSDKKYLLTHFDTYLHKEFYSLRNAVIYATLDKRNRIADCDRVRVLDGILEGTEANITLHETLCKKTKDYNNRNLYETKLIEDKVKKKQILAQLNLYAKEVKKWQYQKFETAAK